MIPDKIYIPQNISRSDVTSLSFPDDKGRGIEYIRKDALLEWARLGLEMLNDDTSPVAQAAKAVFNGLIDKLNSM